MNEYQFLPSLSFILPRVLVATICGFIIGFEREWKGKSAGLRSNILICVGVCLYAAISMEMSKTVGVDPSRIIAQIATGIGFLGAGVIMKNDDRIVGITSASFIWVMSAVGVLAGLGAVLTPIIITLILVILSVLLQPIEEKIKNLAKSKKDGTKTGN